MTTTTAKHHDPDDNGIALDAAAATTNSADDDSMQPSATAAEVMACQFSSWYSTFRDMNNLTFVNDHNNDNNNNKSIVVENAPKKRRKNVTIESRIISPLPNEFLEYLLSDGVMLPKCAGKVSSCMNNDIVVTSGNNTANDGDDDDDDDWASSSSSSSSSSSNEETDDDEEEPKLKKYNFPILTSQIQNAIFELGGCSGGSGGGVLPKLNWSSPKDATWINCGSLKCQTPGDVYLLLKSSEFVAFDLERVWDGLSSSNDGGGGDDDVDDDITAEDGDVGKVCKDAGENTGLGGEMNYLAISSNDISKEQREKGGTKPMDFQYELVLRKWCNLNPSMEFRCFVYQNELVGISQRHPSKFYNHLQHPTASPKTYDCDDDDVNNSATTSSATNDRNATLSSPHPIAIQIQSFFNTYVQHRFPNTTINNKNNLHKYVMDVYIDSQERVWIIDFNIWAWRTDSLLFTWEELMELGERVVVHEVLDKEKKMMQQRQQQQRGQQAIVPEMRVVTKDMKSMTYDPLSTFRGPTDVMDLVGGDGGASKEFEEFMKQCVKPSDL